MAPPRVTTTTPVTADVIARAQEGDYEAFDVIHAFYYTSVYKFILHRTNQDDELARDLTQDVFVKAWLKLPETDQSEPLKIGAWLYRIAFNCIMDEMRRRKVIAWSRLSDVAATYIFSNLHTDESIGGGPLNARLDPQLTVHAHDEQPAHAAEDAETTAEVRRVMLRMTPHYRVCLSLREYYGLSYDEIGQVMGGLTRPAVKSCIFRARDEFRRLWLAHGPWHPLYHNPDAQPALI